MADYDNTNRGALFKNTDKEAENHPDYKGNINVSGTEFWLSAWIKKSKDGKTYMSLSVQAKDKPAAKPAKKESVADLDSDIPF